MAWRTLLIVLALATGVRAPAVAGPDDGAAEAHPAPEAAYRAVVSRANEVWAERPSIHRRDHASCLEAWQTGDRARSMVRSATPPERFAAYHEALVECIDSALQTADECLVKLRGGPNFFTYYHATAKACREVARITNQSKLGLPRRW